MVEILLAIALTMAVPDAEIGIVERTGVTIPGTIELIDENGSRICMDEILQRPTFLGLVYYRCPGICVPFLEGMGKVFGQASEGAGSEYSIVTVSFDPHDTPATALRKKREILAGMKRAIREDAWRFLTADTENIRKLTESVGFQYGRSGRNAENFIHTSSLIALSSSGKIVRYMNGVDFLPAVVRMAVAEADEERPGATIVSAIEYCFDYDPESRKYILDLKKVFGASISLGALLFLGGLVVSGRQKKGERS